MDRLFPIDNKENEYQASQNYKGYSYRDRRACKQSSNSKTILKSNPLKEPNMNINYEQYEKSPKVKSFALNTNIANSKSQLMFDDRQYSDIDISNFGQDLPIRQKYDRNKYMKRTQTKNESIIDTSVLEVSDNELSGLYKPNQKKSRQNSKHIEFCAKVNNLDKLNNQLSSLLDYVNGYSKRPQRQKSMMDLTPNSNIQSYKKDRSSNKLAVVSPYERKKRIEYSPYKNQFVRQQKSKSRNVSPSPINSKTTKRIAERKERILLLSDQIQQKSPITQNKIEYKRQKSYSKIIDQRYSPRYSPRHTLKYQDQKLTTNIAYDEKKYQKSILYENDKAIQNQPDFNATTDLQFFYDSLKRRDQKIQNFNNTLNQKYPQHRQLDRRSLMSSIQKSDNNDQGFKKRDKSAFITQDQIQIYKDIIHNNRSESKPNMKNKQNYLLIEEDYTKTKHRRDYTPLSRRQQLLKELKTSASVQLQAYNHQSRQQLQSYPSQMNIYNRQQSNFNLQKLNSSNNNDKSLSKASSLQASKLNDQINKIKQELKQSKQHKYFLRQRYSGLLNDQTPRNINRNSDQDDQQSKRSIKKQQEKQDQDNFNQFNSLKNQGDIIENKMRQSEKEQEIREQSHITQFKQQEQVKYNSQHRSFIQQPQYIRQERSAKVSRVQFVKESRNNSINRTQFKDQSLQTFMRDVKNGPKAQNTHFQKVRNNISQQPKCSLTPKSRVLQQHPIPANKAETTKLGMVLGEKIEIDLQLRDIREIFMSIKNQQDKWQILAEYLKNELQLQRSPQYWKQLLNISSEEHNPFSKTLNNSNYCLSNVLKDLCSKLKTSFNFYEQNIHHKLSQSALKKQKFAFKDLDLSGKGYLSMQDLICFVNLHSGKFYRNRDIIFLIKSILMAESYQWKNQSKKIDSMKIEYSDMWNQITNQE